MGVSKIVENVWNKNYLPPTMESLYSNITIFKILLGYYSQINIRNNNIAQ
jgi:hypothetical protein